jgi:hypothetical protein
MLHIQIFTLVTTEPDRSRVHTLDLCALFILVHLLRKPVELDIVSHATCNLLRDDFLESVAHHVHLGVHDFHLFLLFFVGKESHGDQFFEEPEISFFQVILLLLLVLGVDHSIQEPFQANVHFASIFPGASGRFLFFNNNLGFPLDSNLLLKDEKGQQSSFEFNEHNIFVKNLRIQRVFMEFPCQS